MNPKIDYRSKDKDLKNADIADLLRYSMEDSDGCVIIRPMDGTGIITIHSKEEAALFASCLMDYFQKE